MKKLDYKKYDIFVVDETPKIRTEICKKEPETVLWIEDYFKPEDSFVNVGANTGCYSLIAAYYCKKVFAFEPAVPNFALLLKNIDLNNLQNKIKPYPFVVGDFDGLTVFKYKTLDWGATHTGDGGSIIQHFIYQTRLDSCLVNHYIDEPTHILIDTDGNEERVLSGMMQEILFNGIPKTIQIEISSSDFRMINWLIRDYPYQVKKETIRNNKEFKNVLLERK